ncbi:MAG: hypothetical protein AAF224_06585 [Pseudomonadota bacterium]
MCRHKQRQRYTSVAKIASLCIVTVIGCGQVDTALRSVTGDESRSESAIENDAHVSVAAVTIADAFDADVGAVADIGFWAHPTLAFNGLVIAAGAQGVATFDIETGAAVSTLSEAPTSSVHIAYDIAGGRPEAYQGFAFLSSTKSDAQNQSGVSIIAVDNIDRTGIFVGVIPVVSEVRSLCGGDVVKGSITLYAVTQNGLKRVSAQYDQDEGFTAANVEDIPFKDAVDCTVDRRDGSTFALNAAGAVYALDGEEPRLLRGGLSSDNAIGLDLFPRSHLITDETDDASAEENAEARSGQPTQSSPAERGYIAVSSVNGVIRLLDYDGAERGAFRLAASFDYADVSAPTAIGVGYGNYGGVYRAGVVALAAPGPAINPTNANAADDLETPADDPARGPQTGLETGYVRLAPWNGVVNALSLPNETVVPARQPQAATDGLPVLDIIPSFAPTSD